MTRLSEAVAGRLPGLRRAGPVGVDYVYVWADGIHVNIRLEEDKLCLLVVVGVRADGTKELVALADGYRESAGSWATCCATAPAAGMRAPVLAVGDGALGFWAALRGVFPETREQRCWVPQDRARNRWFHTAPLWFVVVGWGVCAGRRLVSAGCPWWRVGGLGPGGW